MFELGVNVCLGSFTGEGFENLNITLVEMCGPVDGIPLERVQCFYSWKKACVKIKIL